MPASTSVRKNKSIESLKKQKSIKKPQALLQKNKKFVFLNTGVSYNPALHPDEESENILSSICQKRRYQAFLYTVVKNTPILYNISIHQIFSNYIEEIDYVQLKKRFEITEYFVIPNTPFHVINSEQQLSVLEKIDLSTLRKRIAALQNPIPKDHAVYSLSETGYRFYNVIKDTSIDYSPTLHSAFFNYREQIDQAMLDKRNEKNEYWVIPNTTFIIKKNYSYWLEKINTETLRERIAQVTTQLVRIRNSEKIQPVFNDDKKTLVVANTAVAYDSHLHTQEASEVISIQRYRLRCKNSYVVLLNTPILYSSTLHSAFFNHHETILHKEMVQRLAIPIYYVVPYTPFIVQQHEVDGFNLPLEEISLSILKARVAQSAYLVAVKTLVVSCKETEFYLSSTGTKLEMISVSFMRNALQDQKCLERTKLLLNQIQLQKSTATIQHPLFLRQSINEHVVVYNTDIPFDKRYEGYEPEIINASTFRKRQQAQYTVVKHTGILYTENICLMYGTEVIGKEELKARFYQSHYTVIPNTAILCNNFDNFALLQSQEKIDVALLQKRLEKSYYTVILGTTFVLSCLPKIDQVLIETLSVQAFKKRIYDSINTTSLETVITDSPKP